VKSKPRWQHQIYLYAGFSPSPAGNSGKTGLNFWGEYETQMAAMNIINTGFILEDRRTVQVCHHWQWHGLRREAGDKAVAFSLLTLNPKPLLLEIIETALFVAQKGPLSLLGDTIPLQCPQHMLGQISTHQLGSQNCNPGENNLRRLCTSFDSRLHLNMNEITQSPCNVHNTCWARYPPTIWVHRTVTRGKQFAASLYVFDTRLHLNMNKITQS